MPLVIGSYAPQACTKFKPALEPFMNHNLIAIHQLYQRDCNDIIYIVIFVLPAAQASIKQRFRFESKPSIEEIVVGKCSTKSFCHSK
jgi:hypothetical protein